MSHLSQSISKYQHIILSILVALVFGFLYFQTMPPVNVGYADSDELLTVAYHQGVAHPPGYPLYIAILHLFLQLPLELNIAAKGHLLSVFLASLTLLFTFLTSWKLISQLKQNTKEPRVISAAFEQAFLSLLTTASLGLVIIFWTYAHVAEKFTLSTLFTALIMYFIVSIIQHKQQQRTWWMALSVTFGLAIMHHQVLILLLPAIMYLGWQSFDLKKDTSIIATSIVGACVAVVLSLGLLVYLNQTAAPVSWRFEPTVDGLIGHLTRRDFAGERYFTGDEVSAYWADIDINQSMQSLWQYLAILVQHMGWWIAIIAFLSLRYGHQRNQRLFTTIGLAFLFIGPLFSAYARLPQDWGGLAVAMRQLLPGITILPLLLLFGWVVFFRRLTAALHILLKKRVVITALVLVFPISIVAYRAYMVYPQVDLSQYTLVSQRYQDMMQQFDQDAIVTCYSDVSCFALMFEQYVNQARSDIQVIPLAYPLIEEVVYDPQLRGFTYPNNPYLLFDIVTWNLDKRPVYAVEINDFYYNIFGLDYPFMFYEPQGYYGELTRNLADEIPTYDQSLTQQWLQTEVPVTDPMRMHHKATVGRDHLINGTFLYKIDLRQRAQEEFNRASNLYHQMTEREKQQITALRSNLEQAQSEAAFAVGSSVNDAQYYLDLIPQLIEAGRGRQAYVAAMAAVVAEPDNPSARLALAQMFERMGDVGFAEREFLHVLMLDPQNTDAQDALENINQ